MPAATFRALIASNLATEKCTQPLSIDWASDLISKLGVSQPEIQFFGDKDFSR